MDITMYDVLFLFFPSFYRYFPHLYLFFYFILFYIDLHVHRVTGNIWINTWAVELILICVKNQFRY